MKYTLVRDFLNSARAMMAWRDEERAGHGPMLAAYLPQLHSSWLRVLVEVPIACGEVRLLRRNISAPKWVALLAPSCFPASQRVTSYYRVK